MTFTADLHIHSRFSRATSKKITTRSLAAWAMAKGVTVLGTGDFTHPAWREELKQTLVRDDSSGLYRLAEPADTREVIESGVHSAEQPSFLFQTEISSIYKRHGKTRRIHNLVFMPDLDAAERFSRRLETIGNLASDGRPILGLDSHDLLEIVLGISDEAYLVPAHIWTPWFALFGSKSGFDTIEECFGDLSPHIFALETGLSSDPPMNRMLSVLDRYTLISNSDAHSGENLAREVNFFEGTPSYAGIFAALRSRSCGGTGGDSSCTYAGTAEFFPEEGKYHLDGHRACNLWADPRDTRFENDICPVCGKPLTVGVMHRVMELADRTAPLSPEELGEPASVSLIPLPELLGEILRSGPKSQCVSRRFTDVLREFGSELAVLHDTPVSDLRTYWEPLGEAVDRMRRGKVLRTGGYDGVYGRIRVFDSHEVDSFSVGKSGHLALPLLFSSAPRKQPAPADGKTAPAGAAPADADAQCALFADSRQKERGAKSPGRTRRQQDLSAERPREESSSSENVSHETQHTEIPPFCLGGITYSAEQSKAIAAGFEPTVVISGPGTGKTRVLVGRILYLLEQGIPAQEITALTFTCRAAQEMRSRLSAALDDARRLPQCDTLHALALSRLQAKSEKPLTVLSESSALSLFEKACSKVRMMTPQHTEDGSADIKNMWNAYQLAREHMQPPAEHIAPAAEAYAQEKRRLGLLDYTDLLEQLLVLLKSETDADRTGILLVDEIQDLSALQVAVAAAMLPQDGRGFFGIGDPDQSIYSFRGSGQDIIASLKELWPGLTQLHLHESYRAAPQILHCAAKILEGHSLCGPLAPMRSDTGLCAAMETPDAYAEAQLMGRQIARMLGSTSHTLHDLQKSGGRFRSHDILPEQLNATLSPGDIAVLARVRAVLKPMERVLNELGIPWIHIHETPLWQDTLFSRILCTAAAVLDMHAPVQAMISRGMPEYAVSISDLPQSALHLVSSGPQGVMRMQPTAADSLLRSSEAYSALEKMWNDCGADWERLFARLLADQENDILKNSAQHVHLMTMHAAKGLEFRAVFLPALEFGILPLRRDMIFGTGEKDETDTEEERRLLYVGATRAADAVFFSYAGQRRFYGKDMQLEKSPFLHTALPLCRKIRMVKQTRTRGMQLSLC